MLNRIYNYLIPNHLKHDVLDYTNAKNILNVIFTSIIATPIYSLIYYYFNDPRTSALLFILTLAFMVFVYLFKTIGSLNLSRETFIFSVTLSIFYVSYYTGGFFSSSMLWIVLPPLLGVTLGSIESGIFWTIICTLGVLTLYFINELNLHLPSSPISNELLLRFYSRSGLIIVIFLIGFFIEFERRIAILELSNAKQESDFLTSKAFEGIRAKSEFIHNMSHELRTPLNCILGFAELLTQTKIAAKDINEYCHEILNSSKKLTNMINEILEIANTESSEYIFSPSLIDLTKLINEVIDIFHAAITEKHLTIKMEINPIINKVYRDPVKMRFMISSYLSNAIKFSHENGIIEIRAIPYSPTEFCIEIEDHGIGIKKEDEGRIFEPFEQVDMSMAKKYQGIGIELALTKKMAEKNGGKVGFKSEPGKGSVFYLILPRK
jgi:signal transduction histidine kinase